MIFSRPFTRSGFISTSSCTQFLIKSLVLNAKFTVSTDTRIFSLPKRFAAFCTRSIVSGLPPFRATSVQPAKKKSLISSSRLIFPAPTVLISIFLLTFLMATRFVICSDSSFDRSTRKILSTPLSLYDFARPTRSCDSALSSFDLTALPFLIYMVAIILLCSITDSLL